MRARAKRILHRTHEHGLNSHRHEISQTGSGVGADSTSRPTSPSGRRIRRTEHGGPPKVRRWLPQALPCSTAMGNLYRQIKVHEPVAQVAASSSNAPSPATSSAPSRPGCDTPPGTARHPSGAAGIGGIDAGDCLRPLRGEVQL